MARAGGRGGRIEPGRDSTRGAEDAARRLSQRAAPGGGRPRAPLRRDRRAGAPHPGARVRLDLGRGAPRHAGVPLLPAPPVPPAPRGRGRGTLGGHERDPAAVAQPGRGGRDRRLPRRDHRRAVPARRGARLPCRGVRGLPGADGRAGEPAGRGRRDHSPALDRGRRDPSRPPLAARRREHPTPAAPAAAAPHSRRRPGARGRRAGGPHRRRLDGGPGADAGRVRRAGRRVRRRPGCRGVAAEPVRLSSDRGGLRARRGDRDPEGGIVPPREVRGVSLLGNPRYRARRRRLAGGPAAPPGGESLRDRVTGPGRRRAPRSASGRGDPRHDARQLARHASE